MSGRRSPAASQPPHCRCEVSSMTEATRTVADDASLFRPASTLGYLDVTRRPMNLHFDADPEGAGFDAERLRRIDIHLRTRYLDPGKIAGCQVIVARCGRVAHRATLGAMDGHSGESLA